MSIETGSRESEPEKDLVVGAIEKKLEKLREQLSEFESKSGKDSILRYEKMLDKVSKGDPDARKDAAKEFLGIAEMGEQKIEEREVKEITPAEKKSIERRWEKQG